MKKKKNYVISYRMNTGKIATRIMPANSEQEALKRFEETADHPYYDVKVKELLP